MSVRFDTGQVKSFYESPEGFLVVKGVATKTGVFTYRNPDGSERKELRHPDDVLRSDSLETLAGKPFTLEHPPVLVTPDNADQFSTGSVGNKVHVVGDGLIEVVMNVHRKDAIDSIKNRKTVELSCGYRCDAVPESGVYKGERYDYRQKNIVYNHLCATTQGRAGPECGIRIDSAGDPDVAFQITTDSTHSPTPKRMATLRIDAAEYNDVPETVALAVAPKLSRLDTLETEVKQQANRLEELEEDVDTVTDERDRERGRADAQEILLTNAELILDSLGYERNPSGDYVLRGDMKDQMTTKERKMPAKKMKGKDEESEWEDDEWDGEDEDSMVTEESKKKKKKSTKTDSDDRMDAKTFAKELMAAWKEADSLVPRADDGKSLSEVHFDSAETPQDIKKLVITSLRPNVKLDGKSEGYIDGVYDSIKETASERSDSSDRNDAGYTGELSSVINHARAAGTGTSPLKAAYDKRSQETSGNWEKPLALSR